MENRDILTEIALKLSPLQLLKFSTISKKWNVIFNSPELWRRKLEKEFYNVENLTVDFKESYKYRFTLIPCTLKSYIDNFIVTVYRPNFILILTDLYKKELYLSLYKIYQETVKQSNMLPYKSFEFQDKIEEIILKHTDKLSPLNHKFEKSFLSNSIINYADIFNEVDGIIYYIYDAICGLIDVSSLKTSKYVGI